MRVHVCELKERCTDFKQCKRSGTRSSSNQKESNFSAASSSSSPSSRSPIRTITAAEKSQCRIESDFIDLLVIVRRVHFFLLFHLPFSKVDDNKF